MEEKLKGRPAKEIINPENLGESIDNAREVDTTCTHDRLPSIKLSASRLAVGGYLLEHGDPSLDYWVFNGSVPGEALKIIGDVVSPTAKERSQRIRRASDTLEFFEEKNMGEALRSEVRPSKSLIVNFRLLDYGRSVVSQNITENLGKGFQPNPRSYSRETVDGLVDRLTLMQKEIAHISGEEFNPNFLDEVLRSPGDNEDNQSLQPRLVQLAMQKEKILNDAIEEYDERQKPLEAKRIILEALIIHAEGFFAMQDIDPPAVLDVFRQSHRLTESQVDGAIASCRKFIRNIEANKEKLIPTSELVG